jgi:hypothetical protein
MGRYFEEMRAVLERHGGTVEKFIGDAVMAVFGIPVVREDDALRVVETPDPHSPIRSPDLVLLDACHGRDVIRCRVLWVRGDVVRDLPDGPAAEGRAHLVVELDPERVFESHHQLDLVEAVGTEPLLQQDVLRHCVRVESEPLGDHAPNATEHLGWRRGGGG